MSSGPSIAMNFMPCFALFERLSCNGYLAYLGLDCGGFWENILDAFVCLLGPMLAFGCQFFDMTKIV